MKLTPLEILHVYCVLTKVLMAEQPGIHEMLARADPLIAPKAPLRELTSKDSQGILPAIHAIYAVWAPFTPFEEADIEAEFKTRSLPRLRIVEAGIFRKHRTILKRKRIRNDDERELMEELLADQPSPFDEAEQALCSRLLADYLAKKHAPKPGR